MAAIKKHKMSLSTGKEIKLSGHTICISNSMEIGEGFTKNLFGLNEAYKEGSTLPVIINPFDISRDEWFEIADYQIFLWMHFKDRLRQFGIKNPQIFKGTL
ncbi:hypothetical protein MKQ70_32660 [Chitinophaga sedimenti]|uniref:hypothetical protein n=1 Tax=Chitinophaga sedimenti TaxID=2033606 RepID=UPI0020030951|nr:hypothetical protein [Chitinophaga sedimenti]MCK7559468.1 hypothetical protein [Chitinophaga sedimenti]